MRIKYNKSKARLHHSSAQNVSVAPDFSQRRHHVPFVMSLPAHSPALTHALPKALTCCCAWNMPDMLPLSGFPWAVSSAGSTLPHSIWMTHCPAPSRLCSAFSLCLVWQTYLNYNPAHRSPSCAPYLQASKTALSSFPYHLIPSKMLCYLLVHYVVSVSFILLTI